MTGNLVFSTMSIKLTIVTMPNVRMEIRKMVRYVTVFRWLKGIVLKYFRSSTQAPIPINIRTVEQRRMSISQTCIFY